MYYDGRDLRHLNVKQVRRNIGAVPQDVQLHPQDLWDNIVAHHEAVDADEAWQAARIAGIDSEIRAMPKGMLTPVGASAAVMSDGESQRIAIARALIRDPRILLLDEATNRLDNESQSKVMANLAGLTSTPDCHRPPPVHPAPGRPHLCHAGGEGGGERILRRPGAKRRRVSGPGSPANSLTGNAAGRAAALNSINGIGRSAPSGGRPVTRYCHRPPNPLMPQAAAERRTVRRRRIWLCRTDG